MTLRADAITFAYPCGTTILHDVSLALRPGVVTGLFGPNGCGKSTLLRCLNGSLRPRQGEVTLDNQSIGKLSRREIAARIAVAQQDSPADVPFTVRQTVMLGRFSHNDGWTDESPKDVASVEKNLERLGVLALAERPFGRLSGGERQRVVIARALTQLGDVLLLDEPNAHLDLRHQLDVYRIAKETAAEGKAVLIICHDLILAPLSIDEAVVMRAGRIVAQGKPHETLSPEIIRDVFEADVEINWNASVVTCDTGSMNAD